MSTESPTPKSSDRSHASAERIPWVRWGIRLIVVGLVLWGIWRTVQDVATDFERHQFSVTQLHVGWCTVAALAYALGILPQWCYWHLVMVRFGEKPPLLQSLRANIIGHLGKYVPGKAMVVVLRAGLLRGVGVDPVLSSAAVFVETLTNMAVGATLAALLLAIGYREHTTLLAAAVLLALLAGMPTIPPVFRRLAGMLKVFRRGAGASEALARLDLPLIGIGWSMLIPGWLLLGVSLYASLRAIPQVEISAIDFPLITAAVALAMVAGFLSMIPGGLGVRELVVMSLLAPRFGEVPAVVSAIVLRVTWLLAEGLFSLTLLPFRPPPPSLDDRRV